jgi:tetratricopeptide (TPR) repeat protein
MLGSRPVLWGLAAAMVAGAAGVARADQAPWLAPEWTVRRVVDAKIESTRYAGGEVAVVAFYSGGQAKADGSDIRVAAKGKQLTPHKILQTGPGDLFRIAFMMMPGETRYFVYYGNPKAPAPEAWEPQRGVLLECRRWQGGVPTSLDQVKQAWAKAATVGADFVSHVSFGFNPFGETETPALFHYTGWFVAPEAGTYSIATSSDDDSWVFIDGKEVVSWTGTHGAVWDARHASPVNLDEALHRLDYWHVNQQGPMMAVAGWKTPKGTAFEPIPAKAFLKVADGSLIEMDLPGQAMVADFFPENAGETWWPDQYALRIQFRNISKAVSVARGGKFEWDFGDGQTGTQPNPHHIYLAAGDYTVTLKCTQSGATSTFRTRIHVDRDWWKQAEKNPDPSRKYAEEAALYDFTKLDVRGLAAGFNLLQQEEMSAAAAGAGAELLRRPGLDEKEVRRVGLLVGDDLRKAGKADPAIAAYRQLEERLKAPAQKAEAAVLAAEVVLEDQKKYDDAEKEYQRVLKTYGTSGADTVIRRAHIGQADIWRHRGDGDKARREYAAAAAVKGVNYSPNEASVRVGALSRYVEEYTRGKQWEWAFKFLADWAWEFPADKLQGHWSLLKAAALAAKGDRAAALQEAMDLLASNPRSPYAVRLLLLAAECHATAGEKDKARLLLQTAVEDYPEDPLQDQAREKLKNLGGPIKTDSKSKSP